MLMNNKKLIFSFFLLLTVAVRAQDSIPAPTSYTVNKVTFKMVRVEKGGFWMGVFQGEASEGGTLWYSLVPTDDAKPDFHQPKVFFPCRMTPRAERRGVVVYPGDVKTLSPEEWRKRIRLGGLETIGLHAATSNDPIDSL